LSRFLAKSVIASACLAIAGSLGANTLTVQNFSDNPWRLTQCLPEGTGDAPESKQPLEVHAIPAGEGRTIGRFSLELDSRKSSIYLLEKGDGAFCRIRVTAEGGVEPESIPGQPEGLNINIFFYPHSENPSLNIHMPRPAGLNRKRALADPGQEAPGPKRAEVDPDWTPRSSTGMYLVDPSPHGSRGPFRMWFDFSESASTPVLLKPLAATGFPSLAPAVKRLKPSKAQVLNSAKRLGVREVRK